MANVEIIKDKTTDNETTETILTCDCCGEVHDADDLIEVYFPNGSVQMWCQDCVDNRAFECENCGDHHPIEERYYVHFNNGTEEEWCTDCVENHAFECNHCGELHPDDEANEVWTRQRSWGSWVSQTWCDDCVDNSTTRCNDCDRLVDDNYITTYRLADGGGYVQLCDDCYDENYTRCRRCGEVVRCEDAHYDDWEEEYYCDSCHNEREDYSENVQGYHHTGGSTFWLADGTCFHPWSVYSDDPRYKLMYLGVELETENSDSRAGLADDIIEELGRDKMECKTDGSLGHNGLELVTQPMEPMYHLGSGMWESITSIVRNRGGRSHDGGNCGLHIHISRRYFKDHDAVYRLDRLFHHFKVQLINFSRRRDYMMRWCNIDEDGDLLAIKDIAQRKAAWYDKKHWADRYEAVNDTNENTVEIRLWRGTLNDETLRATIELTAGLAIVANSMSDKLADSLNWAQLKLLVRFALEQNGIPHNDLDSYLATRNL